MCILELKLNEVGTQALHQVANYAVNDEAIRLAEGRCIQAAVIGHRCSPSIAHSDRRQINGMTITVLRYMVSAEGQLLLSRM